MYDKTVRRRRAALLIFVTLSIGLLTVYFGESASGGLHAIQRGAQEVLAPIEEGASRAFKPFRDAINWIGDVFDAKSENKELKDEVAHLREDLAAAQTAQREAEQLRSLVGLPKDDLFPQGTEPVTARVIARSPTSWQSSVQIDKGSGAGIEEDMPVIASGGDRRRRARRQGDLGLRRHRDGHADHRRVERGLGTGHARRRRGDRQADRRRPVRHAARLHREGTAGVGGHDGDHVRLALRPVRVALPARDPDRAGDGGGRRGA